MIIVDITNKVVYSKKKETFIKITGDFEKIHKVIKTKYMMIKQEVMPQYINFMIAKKVDSQRDITIYSYIHQKEFVVSYDFAKSI
jgi:hypothetical protein